MPKTSTPTVADLRDQHRNGALSVTEYAKALVQAQDYHARTVREYGHLTEMRASDRREYQTHQDEFSAAEAALIRLRIDHPDDPGFRVDYGSIIAATGAPTPTFGDSDPRARVLDREQRVTDWCAHRSGGVHDEHRDLSLGAMLRGWLTSRWDGAEREQRALLEGTQAGGGVLVPTPLSASIIDRARNVSRCFQAGARVVPMDSQTLKVPRIAGSPSPAWRAENATIAEGDLTFDSITFTAKSLALIVRASRELIEDGRDVDNTVRNDLAAQVATELDRVMLRGTGTAPEPRGVRNTSGVTITAFGGANGAAPTNYDHLLDAVQVLRGGNYEATGFITAPRSENSLSKLKEATTNAYLRPPAELENIPRYSTNQIPVNLTTGTSNDTTEIYAGDWSHLWLGMRTELVLGTLVERYADVGQIAFLVWLRADVQLSQPGAFNVITGVRP